MGVDIILLLLSCLLFIISIFYGILNNIGISIIYLALLTMLLSVFVHQEYYRNKETEMSTSCVNN